jgi:hypothetical protein
MTKIELRLDRLECFTQQDASGGSEPYLWPMLLWVTDASIGTTTPVRSNHPHTPRTVLGQSVKAGASLAVPAAAGTVRTQLAAGDALRKAIAVVSLLENDETPHHVVVAAYDAYVEALPAAVAGHLLELASDDDTVVAAATAAVTSEVEDAVKSAGSDEMTTWEKFKVGIGSLNLDDQVGSAFEGATTSTENLSFTFTVVEGSGSSAHVTQDWLLTGALVVDTRIDLCASQVTAVNQAKVHRDQVLNQLRALQTQWAQASPSEKPGIQLDIDDAREVLAAAEAALDAAEAALAACRARAPRHIPTDVFDHVIEATHDLH